MIFRTLGLIIWKNLLLRKRQYIVTFLELALPIAGVLFALIVRKNSDGTHGSISEWRPQQTFKIMKEKNLMEPLVSWCSEPPPRTDYSRSFIAYTPDNPETTRLMQLVSAEICATTNMMDVDSVSVNSEGDLAALSSKDTFRGAVVFTDGLQELKPGAAGTNGVISYKIRMNDVPSTNQELPERSKTPMIYGIWKYSKKNPFLLFGPNKNHGRKYVKSGFIGLQLAIDKVLAKLLTNQDLSRKVSLQPFPYPAYPIPREYEPSAFLSNVYTSFTWGLCFMIPSITRNIVGEKQTGIQELLRLTGVSRWIQWIGWLIHVVIPQLFTITILTIILCTPIITKVDNDTPLRFADATLIWIIFLMFVLATTTFCFLVCALFQNPVIATTIAELVYVITLLIGELYPTFRYAYSSELRIGLSVFPNFALSVLLENVWNLEWTKLDESDEFAGARWSTLGLEVEVGKEEMQAVSNLTIIMMLLADILVYGALAMYLECVLPSEHGVKRPWYLFEFGGGKDKASVGRSQVAPAPADSDLTAGASGSGVEMQEIEGSKAVREEVDAPGKGAVNSPPGFEPEPQGTPVGIDVQDISKRFGRRKVAVNGVNLRMFTGDIFALLGHNGAGKTTLISMLSGFFAPTSGTAVINGNDIRKDLKKVRNNMGLCPQHNMLFERLGVGEQLRLFGMLRGLSWKQAKAESNMLLARMAFLEKASTTAKNLSGGQKRKLCLAIALIGGTKIVILDEPTSGMDPQARREIWDILLQLRGERTILLTTHFMEEADVLGDRIGIMASGMVQCCGTAAFLKKYYGTGYTLKLTLNGRGGNTAQDSENLGSSPLEPPDGSASSAILAGVQKHIPNASFKAHARLDRESNEVFITLPSEAATTAALMGMFTDLTARQDKLGIKTIGLQQTTMDEVFLKVGEIVEEEKFGIPEPGTTTEDETFERAPKTSGASFVGQFMSLVMKKFIWSIRKWIMLAFVTIFPFGLFALVVYGANSLVTIEPFSGGVSNNNPGGRQNPALSTNPEFQPLLLSLKTYDSPVTLYSGHDAKHLLKTVGKSGKKVSSIDDALIEAGTNDMVAYKRNHIVAAHLKQNNFEGLFNQYPYHAAPLAINIATNALLKELDEKYRIDVTTQPFSDDELDDENYYGNLGRSASLRQNQPTNSLRYTLKYWSNAFIISLLIGPITSLGLSVLVAYFVVNPIEEKNCNAKQLQTMTGINPLVYWGATFAWDYFLYTLVIFAMLLYLLIFDMGIGYGILTYGYGGFVFFSILMIHGFPSILLSYLISFRSSTVAGGFSLAMLIHIFTGVWLGTLLHQFAKAPPLPFPNDLVFLIFGAVGRLFPAYSLNRALLNYVDTAVKNSDCKLHYRPVEACEEDLNLPGPYLIWRGEIEYPDPHGRNNEPIKVVYPQLGHDIFFYDRNGPSLLGSVGDD